MALEKQPLQLLFGGGIDTKVDPKSLDTGNLLVLENGVLKKRNRIDKRNGYVKLGDKLIDGTSLPSGDNLATFKDELLLYANQNLYSYSESNDNWISKGDCVSVIVETEPVVKNTYAQTLVDSAVCNGVAAFAWEDSRGGVRASVFDNDKKTVILSDVSIDSSGSHCRVVCFQNYLFIFYYKSGSLYCRRINSKAPSSFEAAVQVANDINTTAVQYDVIDFNNERILLGYNYQTATGIKLKYLDVSLTELVGGFSFRVFTEAATNSIALVRGNLNTIYLAYHNNTDGLRCQIFNIGFTSLQGPFTLNASTTPIAENLTGYLLADNSGVKFFYQQNNAATYNHLVRSVTALYSGSASGDDVFMRSVGLASKAFTFDGRGFVALVHDSTLQATNFVARDDGLIIAKQRYGLSGGLTTKAILPNVSLIDSSKFRFAIITKNQLVSENATIYTLNGVSQTELDFSSQGIFTSAELANNLLICGGTLQNYDGISVTEHGFHLFPENITGTHASGSGSIAGGTYYYIIVYEWTDAQGQLHRSAPSIPIAITTTGSNNTITLTIPTLRLTQKKGARTPISIAVYRTENLGTIYYRVSSITNPLLNDPTVDSVTFADTLADSAIISRELLYTTGGILPNYSPGSCSTIVVFKNRIFIGGLENKDEVLYSKLVSIGEPVEFAQEFSLLVDEKGARINTLGKLDEKVVIFKRDRFYITYGDGPDNTGTNGVFAPPEFISSDVGCIDVQSVAQIPGAITFKTTKGIYTLDSSLQLSYFGAPVDQYNDKTVTSAVLKSDVNQLRFTTSDGPCLVYDYYFQQWSTFTNHQAKDAVLWNEQYVYLRETGDVLKEVAGIYKDVDAFYNLKLSTAWISLAGINGYQRVYRFGFLGEYKSPHLLRIKAGYDFSQSLQTVMTFDPVVAMDIKKFGEQSPFGFGSPFGGDNIAYRVRGHMPHQKCQTVRFIVEELPNSDNEGSGESLTLSALSILIGVKAPITKLKSSQSIG